jgi:hypothetical protein
MSVYTLRRSSNATSNSGMKCDAVGANSSSSLSNPSYCVSLEGVFILSLRIFVTTGVFTSVSPGLSLIEFRIALASGAKR